MKPESLLRYIRISAAVPVIILFTFLFIDFSSMELRWLWRLPKIQIVPAIIAGSILILVALFTLTLLFGRIYCSVICPFGILQDVIAKISGIGKKKNKRKKHSYSEPLNILRYTVLAVFALCVIVRFSPVPVWLDPYGNFGRIAKNIFGSVFALVNNSVADISGIRSLYHVDVSALSSVVFYVASIILAAISVAVILRGRLFCNSLCPVGALLSLISKHSIFKLKPNDNCNGCGLCSMRCKAQCIDNKNRTLDFSRCVACYNCIDVCNRKAIGYVPFWKSKDKTVKIVEKQSDKIAGESYLMTKRDFFAAITALIGTAITSRAQNEKKKPIYEKNYRITPPGSKSLKHFSGHCTACHLCVAQCPTGVLKPAFRQYGLAGFMMPVMDYEASFCNFECTLCSEICPNNAIKRLTVEEKKRTQIGKVVFVRELCVVYNDETDCGACSEHCPTKAVDMIPYKGSRIPEINPEICIGCGGCEYICPVRPLRAIYVEAETEHQQADLPETQEKKNINLDGFGF